MVHKPLALIVEDNEAQADLFSAAMRAAGYSVHLIFDGATAYSWLDANVPSVVLLDLHLPHVSGSTLLKKIKLDPRFEKTTIFIVSGDGTHAQFLQEEVELVLNKPISFVQLQALSERFLR